MFDKHPIRIKRIQSGRIVDYNKLLKEGESSRRQDLPDAYIRNGSIYAMKRDTIVKHFSRKGNISLPFIMKEIESINIDEITDFYLAETLIKKGYCNNFPSLFFNERKADYKYKKNKNILITYNKEISQKVFEKFKYKNYGLIFSNFKNLNHIKYKDSIYALLVSTDGEIKINNTHLRKFKNLKYILSPSTGLTHLDIKSFDKNIKILNLNNFQKTKKIMASSEFTISLILNSVRKLDLINNVVLSNNWRNKENLLRGNELSNYKFGIFGFGRIGKNVANFLKQFNNNVFYFDPYVKNKLAKKVTNINVFLKKINFLIISAKLTNETNNFFTFKKLKLLKNNSILINVSRGELIKENDLIKLIQSNHFKKVSLDVLSNENNILNGRNSLIKLSRKDKRLFITPHIAGLTFESEYKALNEIKKLIYKNL